MSRSEWLVAYRLWRVLRLDYFRCVEPFSYEVIRARVESLPPEVLRTTRRKDRLLIPIRVRMLCGVRGVL